MGETSYPAGRTKIPVYSRVKTCIIAQFSEVGRREEVEIIRRGHETDVEEGCFVAGAAVAFPDAGCGGSGWVGVDYGGWEGDVGYVFCVAAVAGAVVGTAGGG